MSDIYEDIVFTKELINDSNIFGNNSNKRDNYSLVYSKSNEDLNSLFDNFDFTEKNCLSVLASGDQTFQFVNRGANLVDTFDKNKLTFYYFYLRIWVLRYLNMYYPPDDIDNKFIEELLSMVTPKNDEEKKAYCFWNYYIKNINNYGCRSLFIKDNSTVNKIEDIDFLRKRIDDLDFKFYNVDLMSEIKIDRKYDYIYISNIFEWLLRRNIDISLVRDNLKSLLNDDGKIICANYAKYCMISSQMMEDFDYVILPDVESGYRISSPGYYYVKKRGES